MFHQREPGLYIIQKTACVGIRLPGPLKKQLIE